MNYPERLQNPSVPFGLVAWLEETRIALPLKGVECRFEITGALASVELDQIYHQNAAQPLECQYSFPLPAGAAVYRCELHINGRVIRAKVEAREEAQRIYREQVAAGRRAGLVESERENLFTLSLGNVQPGDTVVVRFAWFQLLDRAGDGLRLHVPTCPGVRYIPGKPLLRSASGRGTIDDTDQVPDASRISPPRIGALDPDAAYLSIEGRLCRAEVEDGALSSPSHPVFIREKEGALAVALSGSDAVPDRDFVLAWREPQSAQLDARAWHWKEAQDTYALVQLRGPKSAAIAQHWSQDYYFLLDRSGSMAGAKWQRSCQALVAFVRLLGPEDRVWITLFESSFQDFAEAPQLAPKVLADPRFHRLAALGVGGGTELLPAAKHITAQIARHSRGRQASAVLITDGQIGNEAEVLRVFGQKADLRVDTFGIDTTVNDAFLKSLARQQGGGCWLQTPDDDIAGTIAALGGRLRRPVLTGLSVAAPWETACALPNVHAEEVVTFAVRGGGVESLEVLGNLTEGHGAHRYALDLGPVGSKAIALLWAREKIGALLTAGRKAEAIELAKRHNLLCEGAAFVAWDEAEQVPIAQQTVVQPSLMAARYPAMALHSRRAVFCGGPAFHSLPPKALYSQECRSEPLRESTSWLSWEDAGLPESVREAVLIAICTAGTEVFEKLDRLGDVPSFVQKLRQELRGQTLQPVVEAAIQDALSEPSTLLEWTEETQLHLRRLLAVRRSLQVLGVTDEVNNRLTLWVLRPVWFDPSRLLQLDELLRQFQSQSLSEDAREAQVTALLSGEPLSSGV